MKQSVKLQSYHRLLQTAFKNVKGCFFQCLSAFYPLIISVILIDTFFWDNTKNIELIAEQSESLFHWIDDGLNGVLLLLIIYGSLVSLKTVRLYAAQPTKSAGDEAVKNILNRSGSLLATIAIVFIKSVLWGLLFIIPGLVYHFLCGFAAVINAVEEVDTKQAIHKSILLIKKNWVNYLVGYLFGVMIWLMMVYPVWYLLHTVGQIMSHRGYFLIYNLYQYLALIWACGISVVTIEYHYQMYKWFNNTIEDRNE